MDLSILDWFIVVVLAGGLLRGFMKGAIRQVASLAGLLLSFFMAVQFMRPLGEMVVSSLGLSDGIAPLVGFVVVFVGVQLVVLATARLVEQVLESLSLSTVNRIAGSALGGFKAALVLSVLFLVLGTMQVPDDPSRDASTLYGPVSGVLPQAWDAAASYLPLMKSVSDEFGSAVRPHLSPDSSTDDAAGEEEEGEDPGTDAPDAETPPDAAPEDDPSATPPPVTASP